MLIAVPAYRLSCRVMIDRGRAWSVIDELLLWNLAQESRSILALTKASQLPPQVIAASLSRMMRFRLVEVVLQDGGLEFAASEYGKKIVGEGRSLPFFPKRLPKRTAFVIERVSGGFFPTGQVRLISEAALEQEPDNDIRKISVDGGEPPMSHEANFARLSQIAARGWEEQLAYVDGRTSNLRQEYMIIRFTDRVPRGLPDEASDALRDAIERAAALPRGTSDVPVRYGGQADEPDPPSAVHRCTFDVKDLIIGGSAQLACLRSLLEQAHQRVIIHSTFLKVYRFRELLPEIRAACTRGVSFDLLWGAETKDDEEEKNSTAAYEIAKIIRNDAVLRPHFTMHMRTTGSHAKVLLADSESGDWVAAVGSCNWLSSPMNAVELTVVLRDQAVVRDVAVAMQRMMGRRGLADDVANEMALLARSLSKRSAAGGEAEISLVLGDQHEALMRTASGAAQTSLTIGSHRLGSTARPGALMPGAAATERDAAVRTRLLYTMPSGPLKKRHARKLADEAAANGVALIKAEPVPLHGKFVAWDDDDLVVTSLNWASASSDPDFVQSDIGVHIHAAGIARAAVSQLEVLFPYMTARGMLGNDQSSE